MKYKDIVEMFNGECVEYEIVPSEYPHSLKMVGVFQPWSIKEREFCCMKNTIIKNNLKVGYEVATAFGISTLSLGLGLKETKGKLVTMDAYIEENRCHSMGYVGEKDVTYLESNGWKSVNNIISKFDLSSTCFPTIGWSPTNTNECIRKYIDLDKEKLDLVFIDAGHWDDALIGDILSIKNHINEDKYCIFIHDIHAFSVECLEKIEIVFDNKIQQLSSCDLPNGFKLSAISKHVEVVEVFDDNFTLV